MEQALTTREGSSVAILEKVVIGGDLKALTPAERVNFYKATCESLGLNPLTRPFEYIVLNGKLTLYARKDATEQLRNIHGVSVIKLEREVMEGVYTVTAYLEHSNGRKDSSIGAVSIEGLKGESRANAMMKAETKAKRRGTLSICGLGVLDETEVETIADARAFVEQPNGEQTEFDLSKEALTRLMMESCYTDDQREACSKFLKSDPTWTEVQRKLRVAKKYVQDVQKGSSKPSTDNPDANYIPGTESQQEAF